MSAMGSVVPPSGRGPMSFNVYTLRGGQHDQTGFPSSGCSEPYCIDTCPYGHVFRVSSCTTHGGEGLLFLRGAQPVCDAGPMLTWHQAHLASHIDASVLIHYKTVSFAVDIQVCHIVFE